MANLLRRLSVKVEASLSNSNSHCISIQCRRRCRMAPSSASRYGSGISASSSHNSSPVVRWGILSTGRIASDYVKAISLAENATVSDNDTLVISALHSVYVTLSTPPHFHFSLMITQHPLALAPFCF